MRVLGRAHAIDILRTLGATPQGLPFNSIRRIAKADSRSTAALLRDFTRLGLVEHQSGPYRLSSIGSRVLSNLASLHSEAKSPW